LHLKTSAPIRSSNDVVPACTVFHESHAAIKPLLQGIQTQEQLDDLLAWLHDIRYLITHLTLGFTHYLSRQQDIEQSRQNRL
ncbi:hypothetical protein ARMGADRAFT_947083, partial [Armillaria gallica]